MPGMAHAARDEFLERYAATNRFRHGKPTRITITPQQDAVLFLRSGPRSAVQELYVFDTATGQERRFLTATQILGTSAIKLSARERARRERLRQSARGIAGFELSQDGTKILVPLAGRLFVVERSSAKVRELTGEGGYAIDAHFSPDASHVACVRGRDLYVIALASGAQRRLTRAESEHITNGLPEFVAEEEMGRYRGYWWSPDGRRLVYQQTDTGGVDTLFTQDPKHPERPPRAAPYPRAGTANAVVRLGLISLRGGQTRWVSWDDRAFPYLATVTWSRNAPLTVLVQNRRQTEELLLEVDERSGKTRTLLSERDDVWRNLHAGMPRWLPDGSGFLWVTERNGFNELELRARDGASLGGLTRASTGYEALLHVDEASGSVLIRANPTVLASEIQRVFFSTPEKAPERVTPAHHRGVFGRGHELWVDISEGAATSYSVRRGRRKLGELGNAAEQPPFEPNLELTVVGRQRFHAAIVRPRAFDPKRRYPVLVSVYGGPHARVVHGLRRNYLRSQWFADRGFVVVALDGRGTPGRGRAWERAIHRNLGAIPLQDQVAGLQALAERYRELDLARVGIFGWSFGGYMAALAVARRPDVFHAGIAGAPVTDWADYDTHYTERYMGLPQENVAGYRDASLLTHAAGLERPLLIIHGTTDDNVYFTHAVKLADTLLRAGREFEFVPLSGFTHMVADPSVTRALHQRMLMFFRRELASPAHASAERG